MVLLPGGPGALVAVIQVLVGVGLGGDDLIQVRAGDLRQLLRHALGGAGAGEVSHQRLPAGGSGRADLHLHGVLLRSALRGDRRGALALGLDDALAADRDHLLVAGCPLDLLGAVLRLHGRLEGHLLADLQLDRLGLGQLDAGGLDGLGCRQGR